MNLFDIIIILLLISSAIVGFKRGILKEVVMFIGIIAIYFIAFSLKDSLGLFLCKVLPFFKFNGLASLNIILYQLLAFILIASILFTIYSIILKLTGIIQKLVDLSIIFTIPSKIGGFIVGALEGYVILFMMLLVLQIPMHDIALFQESKFINYILHDSFLLSSSLGKLDDCIIDITNLTKEYEKDNAKVTNEKIIQLELKYNIISKEDLNTVSKKIY